MNLTKRFLFQKKLRLLNYMDFKKVFNLSKKYITSFFTVFSMKNKLNYPRLGMVISRKVSKLSCKRNLIKRLIRESFRVRQHHLLHADFVIVVKLNIIKYNNLQIKNFLNNLWMKYYA